MTQSQLDRSVARSTGESPRTVRRLGFSPVGGDPAGLDPGGLYLAVDCPHCRRPAFFPGRLADGTCLMAECAPCDALFAYDLMDVYVTAAARP